LAKCQFNLLLIVDIILALLFYFRREIQNTLGYGTVCFG
jgi:hypothetical protein